MTTRVVIEPEAEADLAEAYSWYEAQRPGLGDDFMLCVEAALEVVGERPRSFPIIRSHTRRILVRRFPYLILFVELPDLISVVGVFHTSRDPRQPTSRAR